jgi:hypothetical protein
LTEAASIFDHCVKETEVKILRNIRNTDYEENEKKEKRNQVEGKEEKDENEKIEKIERKREKEEKGEKGEEDMERNNYSEPNRNTNPHLNIYSLSTLENEGEIKKWSTLGHSLNEIISLLVRVNC